MKLSRLLAQTAWIELELRRAGGAAPEKLVESIENRIVYATAGDKYVADRLRKSRDRWREYAARLEQEIKSARFAAACQHRGTVWKANRPAILDVKECTREQPHSGPCNGWPCAYVRSLPCQATHVFGEDLGRSIARSACSLDADGHKRHVTDDGRWWEVW